MIILLLILIFSLIIFIVTSIIYKLDEFLTIVAVATMGAILMMFVVIAFHQKDKLTNLKEGCPTYEKVEGQFYIKK